MTGLMEQIKPENRRLYDTSRFPVTAYQILADNIRHLLMQQGKLEMIDYVELEKLISSEDLESVRLSIFIMETKADEKFIL